MVDFQRSVGEHPMNAFSRFSLAALLGVSAACNHGQTKEADNLTAAIQGLVRQSLENPAGPGFSFSQAGGVDTDRVCIIGPYTTTATSRALLGGRWNDPHGMEQRDDVSELVFVDRSGGTQAVLVRRSAVDFSSMSGRCLSAREQVAAKRVGDRVLVEPLGAR
jgi:hypothetical protein